MVQARASRRPSAFASRSADGIQFVGLSAADGAAWQHDATSGGGALLVLALEGEVTLAERGVSASLEAGDYLIIGASERVAVSPATESRALVVRYPADDLLRDPPGLATARRRHRVGEPAATMVAFLRRMASLMADCDPATWQKLAAVAVRLMVIVENDPAELPQPRGPAGSVTLARVKASILARLTLPTLDATQVAAENGISVRYLHALFAQEGISFAKWMWRQRLEACRARLFAEHLPRQSIGDIAIECGFNNFSHFSRRFRDAYGISARDLRLQSRRRGSG